jgi:hypothetical protein
MRAILTSFAAAFALGAALPAAEPEAYLVLAVRHGGAIDLVALRLRDDAPWYSAHLEPDDPQEKRSWIVRAGHDRQSTVSIDRFALTVDFAPMRIHVQHCLFGASVVLNLKDQARASDVPLGAQTLPDGYIACLRLGDLEALPVTFDALRALDVDRLERLAGEGFGATAGGAADGAAGASAPASAGGMP